MLSRTPRDRIANFLFLLTKANQNTHFNLIWSPLSTLGIHTSFSAPDALRICKWDDATSFLSNKGAYPYNKYYKETSPLIKSRKRHPHDTLVFHLFNIFCDQRVSTISSSWNDKYYFLIRMWILWRIEPIHTTFIITFINSPSPYGLMIDGFLSHFEILSRFSNLREIRQNRETRRLMLTNQSKSRIDQLLSLEGELLLATIHSEIQFF